MPLSKSSAGKHLFHQPGIRHPPWSCTVEEIVSRHSVLWREKKWNCIWASFAFADNTANNYEINFGLADVKEFIYKVAWFRKSFLQPLTPIHPSFPRCLHYRNECTIQEKKRCCHGLWKKAVGRSSSGCIKWFNTEKGYPPLTSLLDSCLK